MWRNQCAAAITSFHRLVGYGLLMLLLSGCYKITFDTVRGTHPIKDMRLTLHDGQVNEIFVSLHSGVRLDSVVDVSFFDGLDHRMTLDTAKQRFGEPRSVRTQPDMRLRVALYPVSKGEIGFMSVPTSGGSGPQPQVWAFPTNQSPHAIIFDASVRAQVLRHLPVNRPSRVHIQGDGGVTLSMSSNRVDYLILGLRDGEGRSVLAADSTKNMGVTVTLHDSHGVSSDSAKNHVLEVILFRPHTHMHFKISNTTDQGFTLWRPYCPEGDAAMSIEFREASAPDKVFRAHTGFDYTGGMGVPKVFTLAPRNDLIVNVDFQSEWILPFTLETDQIRELEMRAVYRSEPLPNDERSHLFRSKETEAVWRDVATVWCGVATSNWQKVRIINRTGGRFERKK